jgi:uncharacterized protein (DUF362 family)/Pyruvate/2-oxoacid:ferredoxin oxidoreductase delta subunit
MNQTVSVIRCADYEISNVQQAVCQLLAPLGGLSWVRPGMRIALKANLVGAYRPQAAATTHPALLCVLTKMLVSRGAQVVIGDSPGGLFHPAALEHIYETTGMRQAESAGASLNLDVSQKIVHFDGASAAKQFCVTAYLMQADAVINVCKLKTHGMMGMTAGAKNLFGIIPGTEKLQHHFRYAQPEAFADMILDLNAWLKPRLTICDAIVSMEGNGPTKGTPKHTGLLLASENPHALDLCCAHLMDLPPQQIPTLQRAVKRALTPAQISGLTLAGEPDALTPQPFVHVADKSSLQFRGHGELAGQITGALAQRVFRTVPALAPALCTGCGHCAAICPAKAITICGGLARIKRRVCIRCFCCQEFCPAGAMQAHKTLVSKALGRL